MSAARRPGASLGRAALPLALALSLCGVALAEGERAPSAREDAAQGEDDPLARFRSPEKMPASVGEKAEVIDRRGEQLPLDAVFDDEEGEKVRLGDYFVSGRPVLLQFVYYRCPSLCSVVLNGTVDALQRMDWTPGEEFVVVTISINPQETANVARAKKAAYMRLLDRPGAAAGWHWLSGSEANIARVADAAGFGYRFEMESMEYAHGAAIFAVTPEGVLSRTIYGAMYEPRTLRLSLVEAADGKIGTALDRIALFCYHFDPNTGEYTVEIMNVVRVLSGLLVAALALTVGTFLWRERRQRARALAGLPDGPDAPDGVESSGAAAALVGAGARGARAGDGPADRGAADGNAPVPPGGAA